MRGQGVPERPRGHERHWRERSQRQLRAQVEHSPDDDNDL